MRPIINTLVSSGVAGLLVTSALVFAQEPKAEPKPPGAPKIRVKVLKETPQPPAPPFDLEWLLNPLREALKKQAVARPAPPAPQAPVMMKMAVNPVNKAAQLQHLIQQFRIVLRVEYHFARTVCALSPEQRRPIAREGERALRDAAARSADALGIPRQIVVVNGKRVVSPAYPNPRKLILEALARSVKADATPEQAARYQAELDRRAEFHKEVIVHNIVAKLDQEVLLSSEQRDQISAALLAHWDEPWSASLPLTAMLNIDRYFPHLPREHIDPLLSDPQKQILEKIAIPTVFFNDNGVRNVVLGGRDELLEDEELTEARQAAEKADQDDQKK